MFSMTKKKRDYSNNLENVAFKQKTRRTNTHACTHDQSTTHTSVSTYMNESYLSAAWVSSSPCSFFSSFVLSRSRRPFLYLSTSSRSFFLLYMCVCVSTSCRERTCKKTELTKENFTRPILPLSTFCVLHLNSNVEKKRKRRAERARNGTIFIL